MFSKERVLEIGCGHSNHLDIYSTYPGVIGIDRRDDVVKRRFEQEKCGIFLVADGQLLPFVDESFDEIYATGSLEHVHKPEAVLKEAFRVLRPGGKIIIDVPHPRYEAVMRLIAGSQYFGSTTMHQNVFEPEEIKSFVVESGFEVTEFSLRMWKAAVVITYRWLIAKITNNLCFDEDTGELLHMAEEKKTPLRDMIDRLLWLAENKSASEKRFYLLSLLRFPNMIYPWVTYIEARKPLA